MNNEEHTYPLSTVLAAAAWIAVAGTLLMAWAVWVLDGQMMLAILIAETACTFSAIAAVLQIRCFIQRNFRMVRLLYGLEHGEGKPDPENLRRI